MGEAKERASMGLVGTADTGDLSNRKNAGKEDRTLYLMGDEKGGHPRSKVRVVGMGGCETPRALCVLTVCGGSYNNIKNKQKKTEKIKQKPS